MIIHQDMTILEFKIELERGTRYFHGIDFGEGDLCGADLSKIKFEHCILSFNLTNSCLSGSEFSQCNIKCCDFSFADLSNLTIKNCSVESITIFGANTDGLIFEVNYCYGAVVNQKDIPLFSNKI